MRSIFVSRSDVDTSTIDGVETSKLWKNVHCWRENTADLVDVALRLQNIDIDVGIVLNRLCFVIDVDIIFTVPVCNAFGFRSVR